MHFCKSRGFLNGIFEMRVLMNENVKLPTALSRSLCTKATLLLFLPCLKTELHHQRVLYRNSPLILQFSSGSLRKANTFGIIMFDPQLTRHSTLFCSSFSASRVYINRLLQSASSSIVAASLNKSTC